MALVSFNYLSRLTGGTPPSPQDLLRDLSYAKLQFGVTRSGPSGFGRALAYKAKKIRQEHCRTVF